ncbi:hypothetical protein UF75_2214 [Desulfosporosinus sp. I2]|uniref:hypothetical protein n=1 Tax=Desulfosporosinus sp. I2 TaxID=1617025 RepID=UPI0005EE3052|nr:hypothetical protein [Desulfosporosinus sp. I2]KJR47370.1 hypothetical protein UF75_2214 [Desulfosporosinus sp. I2]
MDKKLQAIIQPYDNWDNNVDRHVNLQAKMALLQFYSQLSKCSPAIRYQAGDIAHFQYLHFFVQIKKAFEEEKYLRVCNELLSLMHYLPFSQKRIYNNTIRILSTFLK